MPKAENSYLYAKINGMHEAVEADVRKKYQVYSRDIRH